MTPPEVRVVASLAEAEVAVFIVAEPSTPERPANGGLRLLPYADDQEALADGRTLAERMTLKHRLYATGFAGGKIVARVADPGAGKARVLAVTRALLDALEGRMLTGCDLNVSACDMQLLARRSPYVLAAVEHPVDASTATAQGVLTAFDRARRVVPGGPVRRVLVHGVGAVGRVVAEGLVAAGFDVLTVDRDPSRTVPGARVAAHPWWAEPADAHLLCSASGLITEPIAKGLSTRLVVSGANAPFSTRAAHDRLAAAGALVLPDALANAGAVIVDSIEHHAPVAWRRATADGVYAFVRETVAARTDRYLDLSAAYGADLALHLLLEEASAARAPVGLGYRPEAPAVRAAC
ncbi:MAG: Glu/Leu/Phe/Val dehydrogenase dimerization domain-containing protein [Sandaracinaceae bacterium]